MDINREKLEQSGNHMTPDDYFDLVKLDPEDRNRLIKGYSHGMKNKVQMLCFMIAKPPVILLDEPLTSFDVVVALEMKNLLRAMKHNHIIIFPPIFYSWHRICATKLRCCTTVSCRYWITTC